MSATPAAAGGGQQPPRTFHHVPAGGSGSPGPPELEDVAALVADANAIVDSRRLDTLFQPVVHLATSEVVGFEALTRGPAGSDLESPVRLLHAAELAGRLAELDWICATNAYTAAVAADLHPSMTVFLNFHPATLLVPCPTDLFASARRALDRLRVMVETKESELTNEPNRLFEALRLVRDVGWGVAMDNATASPAALALLPLVRPDVLKLDLRGLREKLPAVAELADGARIYSEQAGATILAQGIEEPEDLMVASLAGATYGQGWLFGRPGPLPATRTIPHAVFPLLPEPIADDAKTPFEIVSEERVPTPIEKRYLVPLCRYLEDKVDSNGPAAVLFLGFEPGSQLGPSARERLHHLIERAEFTIVSGPSIHELAEPGSRARFGVVDPGNPASREWITALLGPHYAAALVARSLDGDTSGPYRRLEYVLTHDRDVVLRVAGSLMQRIVPGGSSEVT